MRAEDASVLFSEVHQQAQRRGSGEISGMLIGVQVNGAVVDAFEGATVSTGEGGSQVSDADNGGAEGGRNGTCRFRVENMVGHQAPGAVGGTRQCHRPQRSRDRINTEGGIANSPHFGVTGLAVFVNDNGAVLGANIPGQ